MKTLTLTMTLAALVAMAVPAAAQDSTEALYKSKCAACHGADGTGNTPAGKKVGAKNFHSPDVAKLTDAELFDITKKGKEKMPAYDKKLTDQQIKDLIKYVHALK